MEKKKPRPVRGEASKKCPSKHPQYKDFFPARQTPPTTHPLNATGAADSVDLPAFRVRLVAARRRLVERIAEDFPADRRFPDSGWSRLLADIQLVIAAVDAVAAEDRP